MLFAAAYPERTRALILAGAEVRERRDEEWPWGEANEAEFEAYLAGVDERWGNGTIPGALHPQCRRRALDQPVVRPAPEQRHDPRRLEGLRAHGVRHRRAPRGAPHQRAHAHLSHGRRPGLLGRQRPLPGPQHRRLPLCGAARCRPLHVGRGGRSVHRGAARVPHRRTRGAARPLRSRAGHGPLHRHRRFHQPRRRGRRSSLA